MPATFPSSPICTPMREIYHIHGVMLIGQSNGSLKYHEFSCNWKNQAP